MKQHQRTSSIKIEPFVTFFGVPLSRHWVQSMSMLFGFTYFS